MRDELFLFAEELWQLAQEIREARLTKRHYRNGGSCMAYNSPCEYLGICSGHDEPDSDNWSKRENVHSELEYKDDSRNVLTNSRLRCFQTCRKKAYYRYELGLERVDAKTPDALYFGSVFHAGLAAWWEYFLPRENNNGNSN